MTPLFQRMKNDGKTALVWDGPRRLIDCRLIVSENSGINRTTLDRIDAEKSAISIILNIVHILRTHCVRTMKCLF